MTWFSLIVILQLAMWGSSEEPPGTIEAGPPESVPNLKETCEQNKNQLEAVKDIMLRNKQSLKKKEEELQEYAKKLSKFKTRKVSRPTKDGATSSSDSTPKFKSEISITELSDDTVDDISQAKTPKAKSSLLQRKLAEDRKIFEQRSKELTESKRAVEEKVEALRQQLEETYVAPVVPVNPVLVPSQTPHNILELSNVLDKDNKITELNTKILALEATIIDLQDNLKEKDSVIDSKTKAITLMSADLSRKGKTTLDTLEDTKDEMRSMQQNFVLVEESLKIKNDNLLKQLEEKTNQLFKFEENIQSLTEKLEAQKEAGNVNAHFSRSTMDTLAETKDAMKSMQENFVLIESSLKSKNEHLLKQLEEREMKLAEAEARILNLESGIGIQRHPDLDDLLYKIEKLENTNRKFQDEKYELQKSIADMQDKIVAGQSESVEDSITQKDNRIMELEAIVEDLKKSNESLEEINSQLQIVNEKNDEMSKKVLDLEIKVQDLESEKDKLAEKLNTQKSEASKNDEEDQKAKELDELNKTMIKLKAQHTKKVKNLQKQLENFKKVSDTNAELVRLGNQVALLEEEKGNLQLSLVDFDELKASTSEWKERIGDLEGKVSAQAKEIEAHIEAIAILENQKLDLMQELHAVRQEVSDLEAENAESDNLRVSAEMKVVNLEEELESLNRLSKQQQQQTEELQKQLESSSQENERLALKISKIEELKSSSESFVKTGSNVDSTESFEALTTDADKTELLRKIDVLTRENGVLLEKLARFEEKAASSSEDSAGSTESFERIAPVSSEELRQERETSSKHEVEEEVTVTVSVNTQQSSKHADLLVSESQMQQQQQQRQQDEDKAKFALLEQEINQCNAVIAEQKSEIEDMKLKLTEKEEMIERQSNQLFGNQSDQDEVQALRRELEDSASLVAEMQRKCADMQSKIDQLEQSKLNIEEGLRALENENRALAAQSSSKEVIKEELDATIASLEKRTAEQSETIAGQEALVIQLRDDLQCKDEELQAKVAQLEGNLVQMDDLRDQFSKLEAQLQQRDASLVSLDEELGVLRNNSSLIEEELFTARRQLVELQDRLERSKSVEEYNQVLERLGEREMQVDELESKLSQRQAEINALKSFAESLEAENRQLRNQLHEEERKTADLLENHQAQEQSLRSAELAKAEIENRLLDLQAVHEQNLRHASNISQELQDAYRMLEQLKNKHSEDMKMNNRRLEDLMVELEARNRDLTSIQNELDEKNSLVQAYVPDEVRQVLEERTVELEAKLVEAEEKAQTQLEKMKKYAALAKKKTTQVEELEAKLKELEDNLGLEKSEKEARNRELQESRSQSQEKDNRIVELEQELQQAKNERDEATRDVEVTKSQLNEVHDRLSSYEEQLKELSEAKDNARELGVRMQVMEAEYMEQLAEINSLKTGNGMLLSKQAQINERLENVEKESEERRILLEKLEKEKEIEDSRKAESATRFQELEAKLHERDAEIENLDNELHNSIDNLVQMQESLRLNSAAPQAALQQSYDELLTQFNVLSANSEETKAKHELLIKENEGLSERIIRLQELNATMQERIQAVETELSKDAETAVTLEDLNARYSELLRQFDVQKADLESARVRLHEALATSENSEHQLRARISMLEQEKHNLLREIVVEANAAMAAEGWGFDESSPIIDVAASQQPIVENVEKRQKREIEVESVADDAAPALFDPSVFGASPPRPGNLDGLLGSAIQHDSILQPDLERSTTELEQLKTTVASLEATLATSHANQFRLDCEISSLKVELKRTQEFLQERDTRLGAMDNFLEQIKHDKAELEHAIDVILSNMGVAQDSLNVTEKLSHLNQRIADLIQELNTVKVDNEQLSAAEEVCKRRALELDSQLKVANESVIIAELEERIARIVGERDLLQLQLNDATRSFDDHKIELQEQLNALVQEKNQLQAQLASTESKPVANMNIPTTVEANPQGGDKMLASIWDENEEDPWGFNDKATHEAHVHIPVVPSAELQLQLKLDELEEKLSELAEENTKLREEGKTAQLKNVKYVKKLKEYKVQLDSVQRQLKTQSALGGFGADLDSAIEEELKNQITALEKALSEAKEEGKKALLEKDNLLKRIDVLTAATERFTEAKEKQDTEVHIWQMRYKEIELKLHQMEAATDQESSSLPPVSSAESVSNEKYEREINELRESVEGLAAENDELQQLLEEQRSKRQTLHDDQAARLDELKANNNELISRLDELQAKNAELTTNNDKLKSDYETLRRQYEQSLMDANEQVQNTRQNFELAKAELIERNEKLTEQLRLVLEEKEYLETKVTELQSDLKQLTVLKDQFQENQAMMEGKLKELELSIEGYTVEVHEKDALIQSLLAQHAQAMDASTLQLTQAHQAIANLQSEHSQKESDELRRLQDELNNARVDLEDTKAKLQVALQEQSSKSTVSAEENIPIFTFESDSDSKEIKSLRAELKAKELEIEHLSYSLNEGSMTRLVQELQDNINTLYNEKGELEDRLVEKDKQIEQLKKLVLDEEERVKRSAEDDDGRIAELEKKLSEREREIIQLKSELDRLGNDHEHDQQRNELYEKQRELESLKFTVSELQSEVANLRGLERLAAEDKATIERLASEKENIRRQAEGAINDLLRQKEEEIGSLKDQLAAERQSLLEPLNLREHDLENLKIQIEQLATELDASFEYRTQLETELAERDRRLAELSISKDTDIYNLGVKLNETNTRLEELLALSEEEQRQLIELRQLLQVKEQQMIGLQQQLQEKTKEYELIQLALQRHVGQTEHSAEVDQLQHSTSDSIDTSAANELDVALYMLHQRDVRCEELTLELMQLLEERDTLQLRLSNAIRVNEELRKYTTTSGSSPKKESSTTASLVEDPLPSRSEGPVEIAKEAINSPIGEDKKALALNAGRSESIECSSELAVGEEHTEGGTHVIKEKEEQSKQ
ncbi:protein lava lamp-like isoform X2 [Phymastichus coffea]|uniref:protein lava lamp-like isoform X2 n=1 Tax=Phymastichus coffea TaxID=108790 RepID=UPI00273BD93E|nr:protein lava lamp-like isoform X2 [Phymastichus coffea]